MPTLVVGMSGNTGKQDMPTTSVGMAPIGNHLLGNHIPQQGLTWVPEVVALEFRYYDGQGWRSSWNSLEQKSLPVAVEISMKIASHERQARPLRATDDTREDSAELEDGDFAGADYAVYRLVVDLPAAPLNRGVQPLASSTAKRRIERLAVPRPLRHPTLSPPRGLRTEQDAQDDHLPDEWLRTDF